MVVSELRIALTIGKIETSTLYASSPSGLGPRIRNPTAKLTTIETMYIILNQKESLVLFILITLNYNNYHNIHYIVQH